MLIEIATNEIPKNTVCRIETSLAILMIHILWDLRLTGMGRYETAITSLGDGANLLFGSCRSILLTLESS
jgi:hypothetical protein